MAMACAVLVAGMANGRAATTTKEVGSFFVATNGNDTNAGTLAVMHQRMGFYVAPDNRLLVLGFYGHTEDPFGKGGIGRVVREAAVALSAELGFHATQELAASVA